MDITNDDASNITELVDNVLKNVSSNRNFDMLIELDALNRVKRVREGTVSSGAVTNLARDEQWMTSGGALALSQTGNWVNHRLDINGDGNFTGTGELDSTNAFSDANELQTRNTDSTGGVEFTHSYDKVGNQTDDGED